MYKKTCLCVRRIHRSTRKSLARSFSATIEARPPKQNRFNQTETALLKTAPQHDRVIRRRRQKHKIAKNIILIDKLSDAIRVGDGVDQGLPDVSLQDGQGLLTQVADHPGLEFGRQPAEGGQTGNVDVYVPETEERAVR